MADYVLVDGDQVIFLPTFGAAMVSVQPGRLRASGPRLDDKRVCVADDAREVAVPGCCYTTPAHPIPGIGTLRIDQLAADQTSRTKYEGWSVLLRGTQFLASFEVQTPATLPTAGAPPIPDPIPRYLGRGSFLSSNWSLRAW